MKIPLKIYIAAFQRNNLLLIKEKYKQLFLFPHIGGIRTIVYIPTLCAMPRNRNSVE